MSNLWFRAFFRQLMVLVVKVLKCKRRVVGFTAVAKKRSFRSSKKKVFLVRISIKRGAGGRFLFLLFPISYCMLSLHIITFPQGYVGALRSNINKTKHQILIKHKFV